MVYLISYCIIIIIFVRCGEYDHVMWYITCSNSSLVVLSTLKQRLDKPGGQRFTAKSSKIG